MEKQTQNLLSTFYTLKNHFVSLYFFLIILIQCCGFCMTNFTEMHDFNASVKKIALKPRVQSKEYNCDLCNEKFTKTSLLNQHKSREHNLGLESEITCQYCSIKCANKPGLRAHERTHLDKKFSCSVCKKSFLILNLLRDHVEKGVCKLENRTCEICSKVFIDKTRKDMHMKIHQNDKPFKCKICNKSFIQKRTLKEHSLTHDTVRHYECDVCGKKFVQKNHLKYHMSSQHPGSVPDLCKHRCDTCTKAFPYLHQLKRHQRSHR